MADIGPLADGIPREQTVLFDSGILSQQAPYYIVFGFLLTVIVVVAACCCCPLCSCCSTPRRTIYERLGPCVRQAAAKCRCRSCVSCCRHTPLATIVEPVLPSYQEATAAAHSTSEPVIVLMPMVSRQQPVRISQPGRDVVTSAVTSAIASVHRPELAHQAVAAGSLRMSPTLPTYDEAVKLSSK